MPAATPARGVWLHATDPALTPALRVLAGHLAERPEAPPTSVTGDAAAPGPGEDLRAIDAAFDRFPTRLLVLAGAALPAALMDRARARNIALMLIEAAPPSARGGWRLFPMQPRGQLARFQQIHARDEAAATALRRQVRDAVPVLATGRLARHAPVPGCNIQELDAMRQSIGARPVWLAHDLPEAEADAAFLAHSHALRRAHRLLMIAQPRDPAGGATLAGRAAEVGFVCARRSADEEIDETTQVYVADAGDDPGLFLRLAPVTFLGGSLTAGAPIPSPVIPAALGSALVFGPHAEGDEGRFMDQLRVQGGGRQINGPSDLGPAVSALLSPEAGADAALRAWSLATDGSEATLAVTEAICDWLRLNGGMR